MPAATIEGRTAGCRGYEQGEPILGDELKEADFTEERIEQVRAETKQLLEDKGLSMAKAARDIGCGGSTLAAWLNGSYTGNNAAVSLQVQRWLRARVTHAEMAVRMPTGPAFVRTRTSDLFVSVFEHAQYAPDFSVLMGHPGLGKTTTGRAYTRTAHNTWMVTCQPSMNSISSLIREIAETIGITMPGSGIAISRMCREIVRRLSGLQALLIIDEAQNARVDALDQLRTFHDLASCGVVLMGNSSILRNLEGGGRTADFAQLFSRVGQRMVRPKPFPEDIEAILNGWNIEDPAIRKIARAVARRPGALRSMDKVLRQAHMRAAASGEPLSPEHLLASAAQLGDEKPLEIEK